MTKVGPKVRCRKCLDVVQSKYRHDFVRCKCGAIFIDGGGDYTRCGGNPEDFDWEVGDFIEEKKV